MNRRDAETQRRRVLIMVLCAPASDMKKGLGGPGLPAGGLGVSPHPILSPHKGAWGAWSPCRGFGGVPQPSSPPFSSISGCATAHSNSAVPLSLSTKESYEGDRAAS